MRFRLCLLGIVVFGFHGGPSFRALVLPNHGSDYKPRHDARVSGTPPGLRSGTLPTASHENGRRFTAVSLGAARQRLAPAAAYPPGLLSQLRDADLGEEEAFLAWQMGQLASGIGEAERRDLVALVARSLISGSQGSTRMQLAAAERSLLDKVPALVGVPGERKPLIIEGGFLYYQRILACETRLAAAIRERTALPGPDPRAVRAVVAEIAASSSPRLSDEQQAAVAAALGRRLAVISGGPGTGKTTIALALARGLVRMGLPARDLALAAPTGKAANRLQESFQAGLGALPAPSPEDRALQSACPQPRPCTACWATRPQPAAFCTTRIIVWLRRR